MYILYSSIYVYIHYPTSCSAGHCTRRVSPNEPDPSAAVCALKKRKLGYLHSDQVSTYSWVASPSNPWTLDAWSSGPFAPVWIKMPCDKMLQLVGGFSYAECITSEIAGVRTVGKSLTSHQYRMIMIIAVIPTYPYGVYPYYILFLSPLTVIWFGLPSFWGQSRCLPSTSTRSRI